MSANALPHETVRVAEPKLATEYADVLTEVATNGTPVIVRRDGEDLAAVIPLASPVASAPGATALTLAVPSRR